MNIMNDKVIVIIRRKEVETEIMKVLSACNPGHDFGVNPKEISDIINKKEILNQSLINPKVTPIEIGHALKRMGFTEKMISGKLYRKISIKRLKELETEYIKIVKQS